MVSREWLEWVTVCSCCLVAGLPVVLPVVRGCPRVHAVGAPHPRYPFSTPHPISNHVPYMQDPKAGGAESVYTLVLKGFVKVKAPGGS